MTSSSQTVGTSPPVAVNIEAAAPPLPEVYDRRGNAPEASEKIGEVLGAPIRERALVLSSTPLRGVPAPPWEKIPIVTLPSPPLLEPEMTDDEAVARMIDAYHGAIRSRFRTEVRFAFGSGPIRRSKWWKTLVEARRLFEEHNIAPSAWCAWCCDLWIDYSDAKTPPPVVWVFSAKRVAERHGWFQREESSYLGGRMILGKAARELAMTWARMRRAIEVAKAWADPSAIVDQFFPEGSYELAVSQARAEAEAAQASLRTRASRGEFLW